MIDGMDIDVIGSYDFSYILVGGCDSLVMVNVMVVDLIIINFQEIICQGIFYMVGMQDFDMIGMYIVVLQVVNGCDFIVNFDFMVIDLFVSIIEIIICEGDIYIFNGLDYMMIGMYIVNLVMVEGCDSIV